MWCRSLCLISQTRYSGGSGTTSYYAHDALGSIRGLYDGSINALNTYEYNAFGELHSSTESTDNDYLFTGQQYDDETGLYFLRARYYDPAIGRLLSQDPYPVNTGNPMELNRYVYTANNPVNLTDPSELQGTTGYAIRISTMGVAAVGIYAVAQWLKDNYQRVADALAFILESVGKGLSAVGNAVEHHVKEAEEAIEDAAENLAHKFVRFAFKFKENLPKGLPSLLLWLVAGIGLWLALQEEDPTGGRILYRGMREVGGKPEIGPAARSLGARVDVDIYPDPGDYVFPEPNNSSVGMSVAPDTPLNLPRIRRGPEWKAGTDGTVGTGKDPVWGIYEADLPSTLRYIPDPGIKPRHGAIQPAMPMKLDEYQDALASTQDQWFKVVPSQFGIK